MHTINNALFIGKVLLELDHVPSTNSYASELMSKSRPIEGTAIIAYHQSQGRGQFGNEWISEPGKNLTLSIILYPKFLEPARQFDLNQAISLGICAFIASELVTDIFIKWPNDLYHTDRKIGGLLIENSITGKTFNHSIIGIGLNINQTEFTGNIPNATSFKRIDGQEHNLKDLATRLFDYIEHWYLALRNGSVEQIKRAYIGKLYKYETESYFATQDNHLFKGKIIGIADDGQLIIASEGTEHKFGFKEVVYV